MASVAAVQVPPADLSFESALKMVERWAQEKPSEDEQLKFLEQAIKDLGNPENVKIFRQAMQELGTRAVKTDEAFKHVKATMDDFVKEHGKQFPGIMPFQSLWSEYTSRWSKIITTSRDFATKTGAEYDNYTVYLTTFGQISTTEEVHQLAAALKKFADKHPVGIPTDFQDQFLKLRREVEKFQTDFDKYLTDQGGKLEEQAEALRKDIKSLEAEIAGLNKQIKDATLGLEIASWWGPVGAAIAGTAIGILAIMRAKVQKKLDGKNSDLDKVKDLQSQLGKMKIQFTGLVPDFVLLTTNLNLFADTWNAFHMQALEFATKFELLKTPDDLPLLYKNQIGLALTAAYPLKEGLKDYAATIHL